MSRLTVRTAAREVGAKMNEARWYYLDGEGSVGPFSWERLMALLSASLIGEETLVWREGFPKWRSLKDVERDLPPPLPSAADVQTTSVPRQSEPSDSSTVDKHRPNDQPLQATQHEAPLENGQKAYGKVRSFRGWRDRPPVPWRRFFARYFDILFNGSIGFFLLGTGFYAFAPQSAERFFTALTGPESTAINSFLTILISMPISAAMIGLSGFTLGKALLGVKVVGSEMEPIGLVKAFRREIHVWYAGVGLGIPIVWIVTALFAKRRLANTGSTLWDGAQNLVVLHRPNGALQYLLYVAAITMFSFLVAALISM